jgi:acylphosphatase
LKISAACIWVFNPTIENHQSTILFMTSTEKPVQARRYLVRGRVQGVGFRWFVEREAHILGIAGWVRNNHDGSVEVLAQGTRDQLSGLHSRLREGPRAARVDSVEVDDEKSTTGLSSFRIEGAS